jgi:sporulation protein YlmC with PRC-barrel domain
MKRLMLTVAGAALGIGMTMPSLAQTTDADCRKMFENADTNKDGALGAGESDKFVVLMSTKPKDAAMVTMEEFLAECRKDAFKTIQEAALAPPAQDSNAAAKSSSDAASGSTAATQPTTEQSASSTTTTEQSASGSVTTEQPAASTTTEQSASTATTEQSSAATTTEQTTTATTDEPASTTTTTTTTTTTEPSTAEQSATTDQPAATTTEQSAATSDQPAASASGEGAAKAGEMLASKLIGTTVMTSDNQSIGEVNDIVIDVENEKAAQAIIGVGGFLGIGEKNVAIDLSRLNVTTDGATNSWTVVIDTTQDELNQMPEYKAAAK